MGRHRLASIRIAYALLVASIVATSLAVGAGIAAANHGGSAFAVGQGGQCVAELHPLGDDSLSGPEYYDYRSPQTHDVSHEWYASHGTTDVQETYRSQLYVYAGSDGTSLVFLHDRYGDGTGGGAVTFDVTGLPTAGEWTVEDDDYLGQDDVFDHDGSRSELNWMYGNNRTDGAVFLGLDESGWSEITIDPAFKEESYGHEVGWDQSTEGPNDWVARSADGTTAPLDMDRRVSIRAGTCASVSPEAVLSAPEDATTEADVTLDATNPDSPTSPIAYEWDFDGDGTVDDTAQSPTVDHRYTESGEVTAAVTVIDRFGNEDTATATIDVGDDAPPTAVADVPASVGTGETLTVDGSGSSDDSAIASYAWEFGDGETAAGETATHAYDAPGTYTVTLTVTDDAGETDTDTAEVTVTDATPPSADLSVPESVAENESFQLDASGSSDDGEIVEYRWDVDGDGSPDETTTEATLAHSFAAPGDHEVAVTVVDDAGNEATASATVHVVDETPPSASLSVPANATAGTDVTLDASASTDDVGIDRFEWTFGDGATDTTADAAVNHEYAEAGTYEPTVRVVDADGNADVASATITVEEASSGNETGGNDTAPTASFSADPTTAAVGEPVAFDAGGSSEDVVGYAWEFGDGETGSGETTTHVFDEEGDYAVTLTVTDDAGGTDTAGETITVVDEEAPVAGFTVDDDEPVAGQELAFDADAADDASGIAGYDWEFGDGETGSGETATHAYATNGTYTVALTVTDGAGNANTTTMDLTVGDGEGSGGDSGDSGDGDDGGDSGGSSGGSAGGSSGGGSSGGSSDGGGAGSSGGSDGSGGDGGSTDEEGNASGTDEPEHDFVVTAVSTNRSSVLAGESIAVNATVENRGDATGTELVGPILDRRPVAGRDVTLEPNESATLSFAIRLEEPGTQTVRVGDRETSVTVRALQPETAVETFELEDGTVDVGETATIVATVANTGRAAGEHAVELRVFDEVVDRTVVTVPPGETRTVRFTQRFDAPGDYSVAIGDGEATVRVVGEPDESGDGTFTVTVPNGTDRTTALGFVAVGGLTLAAAAIVFGRRL